MQLAIELPAYADPRKQGSCRKPQASIPAENRQRKTLSSMMPERVWGTARLHPEGCAALRLWGWPGGKCRTYQSDLFRVKCHDL